MVTAVYWRVPKYRSASRDYFPRPSISQLVLPAWCRSLSRGQRAQHRLNNLVGGWAWEGRSADEFDISSVLPVIVSSTRRQACGARVPTGIGPLLLFVQAERAHIAPSKRRRAAHETHERFRTAVALCAVRDLYFLL